MPNEEPYLIEKVIKEERKYNPKYGDDRMCACGHLYREHFDSQGFADKEPSGCRHKESYPWWSLHIEKTLCGCITFVETSKGNKNG